MIHKGIIGCLKNRNKQLASPDNCKIIELVKKPVSCNAFLAFAFVLWKKLYIFQLISLEIG